MSTTLAVLAIIMGATPLVLGLWSVVRLDPRVWLEAFGIVFAVSFCLFLIIIGIVYLAVGFP